ncbi:hypothetical protein ACFL09_04660 [Planctomycetota bacterium]
MTEADRIIEEIRRSRCQLSEECGHDVARVIERLQDANRRYAEQVRRYEELRRTAPAATDATD